MEFVAISFAFPHFDAFPTDLREERNSLLQQKFESASKEIERQQADHRVLESEIIMNASSTISN